MKIEAAAHSIKGRRERNEDFFGMHEGLGLFVVADGMGGYAGGAEASRTTVESLELFYLRNSEDPESTWPFGVDRSISFAANLLKAAIATAQRRVCAKKIGTYDHMGSTLVALAAENDRAVIGHVGDSRIYRLRGGELIQLTHDHSLYNQLKAAGGKMPSYESFPMKNVITRAVGMSDCEPELAEVRLEVGDRYLLCSDGQIEAMSDPQLAELMRAPTPAAACEALVAEAMARGSKDNITAMVLFVTN